MPTVIYSKKPLERGVWGTISSPRDIEGRDIAINPSPPASPQTMSVIEQGKHLVMEQGSTYQRYRSCRIALYIAQIQED